MQKRKLDHNGYTYNSAGVCENPTTVLKYSGKVLAYTLQVSECHVGWLMGYSFQINGTSQGCGGPVCLTHGVSSSKSVASLAAAMKAWEYFAPYKHLTKRLKAKDMKLLEEFIFSIPEALNEEDLMKMGKIQLPHGMTIEPGDSPGELIMAHSFEFTAVPNMNENPFAEEDKQIIGEHMNDALAYYTGHGNDQPLKTFINQNNNHMATKKSQPATDAGQLMMIATGIIIPSSSNKLHREAWELDVKKDPSFAELVQSVTQHQVIQSLVVRPHKTIKGKYELVCGERRHTAAGIAKVKELPCIVRNLTDEEAFELQIVENLDRKDVHPLKEGESYRIYMEQKKSTIDDLVLKFSKTRDYIMQRLSFNLLTPEFKKDFYAGKFGAGHAALFARLTPDDQKRALQECRSSYQAADAGGYKSIKAIEEWIRLAITMELSNAPFSTKDAMLIPACGACVTCAKRSGAGLFTDVKDKDRCFDGACFKQKFDVHLQLMVTQIIADGGGAPVIKRDNGEATHPDVKKLLDKAGIKVLRRFHDFDEVDKDKKGAVKALCVAGSSAGKFFYIKVKKVANSYASSPGTPAGAAVITPVPLAKKIKVVEEEIANLNEQIKDAVANALEDKIFDFKPYKAVDPKPLTKYEEAGMLMAMYENAAHMNTGAALRKAVKELVGGKMAPSNEAYRIEQFANMPANVRNFLIRSFIHYNATDDMNYEEKDYWLKQLAAENKAINRDAISAGILNQFKEKVKAANEKLMALKQPPLKGPKPAVPAKKKAAVKK